MTTDPKNDPNFYTQESKRLLNELIDHLHDNIKKVNDPKAEALFETSAEVIAGITAAFEHYEEKSEAAWQ